MPSSLASLEFDSGPAVVLGLGAGELGEAAEGAGGGDEAAG